MASVPGIASAQRFKTDDRGTSAVARDVQRRVGERLPGSVLPERARHGRVAPAHRPALLQAQSLRRRSTARRRWRTDAFLLVADRDAARSRAARASSGRGSSASASIARRRIAASPSSPTRRRATRTARHAGIARVPPATPRHNAAVAMADRHALVAGATGHRRTAHRRALHESGWRVTGLCRRPPAKPLPYALVAVDLTDAADCRREARAAATTSRTSSTPRATTIPKARPNRST